jgi:hypothetical protein
MTTERTQDLGAGCVARHVAVLERLRIELIDGRWRVTPDESDALLAAIRALRQAGVVNAAMIERAMDACCETTKAGKAYFAPESAADWHRALTAALTTKETP